MLRDMDLVVTAVVGWLVGSLVLTAVLAAMFHGGYLGEGTEPR